ncbi:MAG TPA: AAA family ATPase [Pyrinomonadaceae bacterium]|nr:AAA family ATPase [Pyrinomonadaceae bacterium]
MIPHDYHKLQINPRKLVLEGRETELYALVCQTGYVPEEQNFSDFCQSLKSGRGWLISGTRGSGKTAFPEALATACNLTICIVAGRDGLKQEEILYDWDKEEQAAWMNENLRMAKDAPENEREKIMMLARQEKWKRDFLILGEMGLAYDLAAKASANDENLAPPILILDESDKFGASVEDAMLMPLERGLIYIPRLLSGYIGVSDWQFRPIVVTTSNDLRHKLSAPFISRHIFSRFSTPSLLKELEILRARCPNATSIQLALAAKLLDGVRGVAGLEDYPSLRESIDVVGAFERDCLEDLDENSILRYFCYFVKTSEAQEFLKLQIDYLLLTATAFHPLIDRWLAERDEHYARRINHNFIGANINGLIQETTGNYA